MGKAVLPGQRGESHDEKEGNKNHNGRDLLRQQEVGCGCVRICEATYNRKPKQCRCVLPRYVLYVRESVLQEDKALIRAVLDRLNSKHKELLATRYIDGHNWEFTACRVGLSRRQTIRVSVVALTRLGVLLQDEPQAGEILARARDACAL